MPKKPQSEAQDVNRPADPGRREFLGTAAAAAAAVAGVPALLAACSDRSTEPTAAAPSASAATHDGPRTSLAGGRDPGVTLHYMVAATVGTATDVKVPALEKGVSTTYIQRIVTDTDRTGTGLATVLKASYRFSNGTTVQVIVQSSQGRAWAPRSVKVQSDLAYAMKDALATNPLHVGVLKDSLTPGNPVVALSKSSIVAFRDGVASDYYGNHLDLVSRGFCDIFNTSVDGIAIASTMRDLNRC
jgi:hypothetical protein